MTNFRTSLSPMDFPFKISHQDVTLCIGSCFAENIGKRLRAYQFSSQVNPFGILYNPISIGDHLLAAIGDHQYDASELFMHQGLWHHFRFHSRFSDTDSEKILEQINTQTKITKSFIEQTNLLIITLGTANVFVVKSSGQVVANCHKLPGNDFDRRLLTTNDCTEMLYTVFEKLNTNNPNINIILTVSPIRHIRDGLIENHRSKATLLLAAAELEKQFSYVHYFPAWELMMDDLRDYRFYEPDMIHPSKTAIDYIWSYFSNAVFSEETKRLLPKIEKVIQAAHHRPFQINSSEHQDFLLRQLEQVSSLCAAHPYLSFEKERILLEEQLVDR